MQWTSEAIIIKQQQFSDDKLLCWFFSSSHGVYKGLLTLNKKTRNQVQLGNIIHATWRARLEEHLGSYYCELLRPLSMAIINDKLKLNSVLSLCSILSTCLPERTLELKIYDETISYLLSLKDHKDWITEYIRLELSILQELGYGLNLDACADTGSEEDLYYVSPRTGRAVSKSSGEPYHDKLLLLPQFLINEASANEQDITNGLKLNEHFIHKNFYQPHSQEIPQARIRFSELLS